MKHSMTISLCVLLAAGMPCACGSTSGSNDADGEDSVETFPDAAEDTGPEEMAEPPDDGGPDPGEVPDADAEARCGNGALEAGEECDDGNSDNGDGCENDCTWTCENDSECDGGGYCTLSACNAAHECEAQGERPFLHHVIQISAGYLHTCALIAGGAVKCWGDNQYGQVGDGTTTNRTAPVDVTGLGSGVAALAAGGLHTCAIMEAGGMKCWGNNSAGQLGNGTSADSPVPVNVTGLPATPISAAAAGGFHTCLLFETGGVKCWGQNTDGQLGNGTSTGSDIPVDVPSLTTGVGGIAAGRTHTCAVLNTGGVRCWGSNFSGQLGNATTSSSPTPVDVAGIADASEVTAGGVRDASSNPLGHTCSLSRSGGAMCWGNNGNGQIGDSTTVQRLTPAQVVGLTANVTQISAGGMHTCAIMSSSQALCWGANAMGQMGDGTTVDHSSPVLIIDSALAVSLGQFHTCALLETGEVRCWGMNSSGQLGDGTTDGRSSPVEVLCQ